MGLQEPLKLHMIVNLENADDVNILGDNIDTIKKSTQTLIDASKEIGPEVNTEKTKYMSLSCHQNARQNHDIKMGNSVLKIWHNLDIWK
jgi:hypothetical protein